MDSLDESSAEGSVTNKPQTAYRPELFTLLARLKLSIV